MKIKVVYSQTVLLNGKKKQVIRTIIGRKQTDSYQDGNGLVVMSDSGTLYNIPSSKVIRISEVKHD